MMFLALIVIVVMASRSALPGGSVSFQLPLSSATTDALLTPAPVLLFISRLISIFSPGSAVPQIGVGSGPCCSTMLSENIAGSLTSARVALVQARPTARAANGKEHFR